MQKSIATVSLCGTLSEKLQAAAAAGFDGVELFEPDLLAYPGSPRDVRRMADDLGLQIFLFQPFRDFEGVSAERLAHHLRRAERKFELMHELGASRLLVCSSVAPDTSRDDALIVDQLGELARLAQRHGVVVGYEALAWGRHVFSYQHAWRLVDAVGSPHLGLVVDSFHTLALGDSLDLLRQIPGDRIVFAQIADAPRLHMDVIEWSRHFRCFPGQGDFALDAFVAPLLVNGYTGPLSLEVFNDDFRAASPADTAKDGVRSLLFLEETAAQRLADDGVPAPVPLQVAHAPQCRGFEFVEFAVDQPSGERFAALLAGLGFQRVGRHRSKNVTLYRQGEINVVLNAEANSFASQFFDHHGISLCAVATRVSDATAAFERALAYGYRPFLGRTGPNERCIPGVQAPTGSLVYFVGDERGPSIYETDFLLDDDGAATARLEAIDHLSVALPADAMSAALLFYRTAFCLQATKPATLADPYGLVRSQAMQAQGRQLQIVLNASVHPATTVGRMLSTYGGSGLHHLAFATQNIVALARHLQSAHLPVLQVPPNYYDDLAARFDLDADTLRELASLNLLYDRDEHGGELLHLYLGQVENRFSIEILERRHGYTGFGASNAPIRLAAQAHSRPVDAPWTLLVTP